MMHIYYWFRFKLNSKEWYTLWHENAYLCFLTHKRLETQECVLSIVGTDAVVLKHQGISTHSAD